MAAYWVKSPRWLKSISPVGMKWDMPVNDDNAVYITFDDGPHPVITPQVLSVLQRYNAQATFFCVGNNVARFPEVYKSILAAGHTTGNHTYNHLNGWKTKNSHYLKNIQQAAKHIHSLLFRPPYGRMKLSQYRKLKKINSAWKVYMWDILSGDFDQSISPEQCLNNVINNIRPGSIIVFHDSEKANERLLFALPKVLEYCSGRRWQMKVLG